MNFNEFAVIDFETDGKNPIKCTPIQVGVVMVDAKRLTLGETFSSMMYADPDQIDMQGLLINKKSLEQVAAAPKPEFVWRELGHFIQRANQKGSTYTAPILAGYNVRGYDGIIVNRLCQLYGPFDTEYMQQTLFNRFFMYDLVDDIWRMNESSLKLENMKLDTLRKHFGIPTKDKHDALLDAIDTAQIICKFLAWYRKLAPKWFEQSKGCLLNSDE